MAEIKREKADRILSMVRVSYSWRSFAAMIGVLANEGQPRMIIEYRTFGIIGTRSQAHQSLAAKTSARSELMAANRSFGLLNNRKSD